MATIGTIELIAKIDTSQYKKGAAEIDKTNKNIESSTETSSKKVGSAWSTGAQIATAAVVAAGALMVRTFVNSASEIQSLRASFESLTGNVEDTNSVMSDLYELGKRTAFSNKDIQAAGRNYLAAGVAVEDLGEILQNTADIAGATGADLGQLTLPLTQTIARGKLQTQDFYQILNSGAGALRKPLTELAGKKGFGSLAEALEKGEITSNDLLKVMRNVTKEGGFAFQGAIKQSETFNGRMSNLREAITNVGLSILGVDAVTGKIDPSGPFAKLSNAVSGLTNLLVNNEDTIKQVGSVIGIFLIPAIIRLGVQSLIAGGRIAAGILLALGPLGLLVAAVGAATYLINKHWETVKTWLSDFWWWVQDVFGGVGKWFTDRFDDVADGVNKAIRSIIRVFNKVRDAIFDWYKENRKTIENIAIVITTILLPRIAQIGAHFVVSAARAVASAALTTAAWVASAAKTSFVWVTQTLPKIIAGFFMLSVHAAVSAAKIAGSFALASVSTLVSWTVTFAKLIAGLVIVVAQAAIAGGRMAASFALALGPIGLVVAAAIGAGALIINNWERVKSWFGSFWRWLRDTAAGVWGSIKGFFVNIGATFGDALGNAFKSAVNAILGFLENRINSIVDVMNNAIHLLDNITPGGLPRIDKVALPRLAEGGIVTRPTIAEIAEGGEAEAVIPLSKLDKMLENNRAGANANGSSSGQVIVSLRHSTGVMRQAALDTIELVNQVYRAKGQPEIGVQT